VAVPGAEMQVELLEAHPHAINKPAIANNSRALE